MDGCADDDWTRALIQLDGPMDSEDVAGDDGDEEAGGDIEGDGQEDQAEGDDDGADDGADGDFDAAALDSAADASADMCDTGFVSAADELSAAAASAGFTAAELSSHAAELDADDPAAAYMMQVHSLSLFCGFCAVLVVVVIINYQRCIMKISTVPVHCTESNKFTRDNCDC